MIFRLCGKEKTPLVKQVNQVHGLTRWICNYHFVGVGFEKKVGKCFLFKVTWKFGKTKKRHVVKWNMTRSRFFPHLALKCLCCFGMFLFCPKFCFWKILETHIRKVRSLKIIQLKLATLLSRKSWWISGPKSCFVPDTEDFGKLNKNQMHWWFCFPPQLGIG